MRILSVKVAVPSRQVTNKDILALLHRHSQDTFSGDLELALDRVERLLNHSGAESRYWLNQGESPLDLIAGAVGQALYEAALMPDEIDLMIYAGVDRGFLEPANAYFVAQALNLDRVHCFDVLDACNGWSRALLLVHSLFKSGHYKRAMIINGEFNMFEGGTIYPKTFRLNRLEDLEYSFAGYTLGEAAAVTILDHVEEYDWEFQFVSRPDLADLCSVPEIGYQRYSRPSERTGRNGVMAFYSYSRELFDQGLLELIQLVGKLETDTQEIKIIFPHAASKRAWVLGAGTLGLGHLMYFIYPQYGNLVSASVPAAMALALADGSLSRGDRILALVGSAGMSFSAISGIF